MRGAVEDRELPEELARSEDRDDRRLRSLVAREDDLDRAAIEDEQGVAGIALVEDRLAASKAADTQHPDERLDRRVVSTAEQTAPSKCSGRRSIVADRHPSRPSARSARSCDRAAIVRGCGSRPPAPVSRSRDSRQDRATGRIG